ncbi:MAG: hypothetical protein AUG16_03835 [Thaumarchaeota archaeon 13_1_20CM_2_39_20]|nr:MAG: hypothetical protein AUI59_01245 [Thaumarchaeota archaeon 13_1_40CM_2_39_13_1]OLE40519.1 MAG: hypothetical protein AUG16_03835 [Thaumarchaeota archaeon 13_1_20CM_2_39_20]
MRHFVICPLCQAKFYIDTNAKVRSELPRSFMLTCPICHKTSFFTPYNVSVESSALNTTGGALLGGLIGLAAGGAGAIIGAILGAAVGESGEKAGSDAVQRFNSS